MKRGLELASSWREFLMSWSRASFALIAVSRDVGAIIEEVGPVWPYIFDH
jgi:hypothetical protein